MLIYTIKRLLQIIPSFFVLTAAVFHAALLMRGIPALPQPTHVMYINYMRGVLQGNWGYLRHRPILDVLLEAFPHTAILAFGGIALASIIGVFLGILAAKNQNKLIDNIIMTSSLLASSIPLFFLAVLLMLVFSLHLGWLPSLRVDDWRGMVMPITTLALPAVGFIARTTRTSMLDVLNMDAIKAARARGIPENRIIYSHAWKNTLIPVITAIAVRLGELLAGTVLVELSFSIPGLGRHLLSAIIYRNIPLLMGCVIFLALAFMLINLVVDLLYAFVDPRTEKNYR